jgi:hypothetical protein
MRRPRPGGETGAASDMGSSTTVAPGIDMQPELPYAEAERAAAYRAVRRALRTGVLVKPCCCQHCGRPADGRRLQAHHEHGYSGRLALVVEWLCSKCHRAAHVDHTPTYVIRPAENSARPMVRLPRRATPVDITSDERRRGEQE